ncbi:MAG TPA: hypothetical protein VNJ08_15860 [Bacteriovoracaceae bacterium]|nr:hypothetical protein [Bacteriovoracaceae bacterium]
MNTGNLNLFLKMVKDDYKLDDNQVLVVYRRLLGDDREFEIVWRLFKNKSRNTRGGVDPFRPLLQELLT